MSLEYCLGALLPLSPPWKTWLIYRPEVTFEDVFTGSVLTEFGDFLGTREKPQIRLQSVKIRILNRVVGRIICQWRKGCVQATLFAPPGATTWLTIRRNVDLKFLFCLAALVQDRTCNYRSKCEHSSCSSAEIDIVFRLISSSGPRVAYTLNLSAWQRMDRWIKSSICEGGGEWASLPLASIKSLRITLWPVNDTLT